ncbi:DUF4185 domain-containing protein [Hoyosella altamirensis]|uniref:DUF4185 domain-containing protein n=1 Tax=Hoyosella altamirensis TaxID=616997 RepID=A0A839RRV7_9ACTN|nr:DUF4185 domain-containing protein [Hoyosella altamirensis]MBB3038948.1 hypothetical protein [Hoyosella altamirensis]
MTAAFTKLCDLTGPGTSSARFGVVGTDLGIPAVLPDHETIGWVFGDTFEGTGPGTKGWRSPVLLRSRLAPPSTGVTFTSAAGGDYAKRLIPESNANGVTWLPADVLTLDGTIYLWAMRNNGLHHVTKTRIFTSTDHGEHWSPTRAAWSGRRKGGNMQLITWERGGDGYVYAFTTGFQRNKPLYLYRVAESSLLNKKAWTPWGWTKRTGWQWGNKATPVLTGQFGEISLRQVANRFVLSWFDAGNYQIRVAVLTHPTNNLYRAPTRTVLAGTTWDAEDHAGGRIAQLYGGYVIPGSSLEDLYLAVSQWNTGTNSVYKTMVFHGDVGPPTQSA